MSYTTKAAEYLRGGGATNDEKDFFFVAHLKMVGQKACHEVYRFWARLLRH